MYIEILADAVEGPRADARAIVPGRAGAAAAGRGEDVRRDRAVWGLRRLACYALPYRRTCSALETTTMLTLTSPTRGHPISMHRLILYDQVGKVWYEHEQNYEERQHEKSSKGKVRSHLGLILLLVCWSPCRFV